MKTPWFLLIGVVVAACGPNICPDVDTACTDGRGVIILNQDFTRTAAPEEVALVVLHETAHILLRPEGNHSEEDADLWALNMIRPGFDFCRLARILENRDRPERAVILCPEKFQ